MRNGAWLHHQELIKSTSSSSIPKALEGAARRSICAKCASSVHTIRSARSSSGLRIPDRLIDFRQLSIQQYSLFQTLMIHETVHERL